MRLAFPDRHAEAITSRRLALHGIARRTRHSNQTTVEVTSTHAKALLIAAALTKVSVFLKRIKETAEHLTKAALVADPERRLSAVSARQGAGKHRQIGKCYCLAAAVRLKRNSRFRCPRRTGFARANENALAQIAEERLDV